MKTHRTLALRREHLTALSPDDMGRAAAGLPHTLVGCLTPECPTRLVASCTYCTSIRLGICLDPA